MESYNTTCFILFCFCMIILYLLYKLHHIPFYLFFFPYFFSSCIYTHLFQVLEPIVYYYFLLLVYFLRLALNRRMYVSTLSLNFGPIIL